MEIVAIVAILAIVGIVAIVYRAKFSAKASNESVEFNTDSAGTRGD